MIALPFITRRLDRGDVHLMRKLNTLFGKVFGDPDTYRAEPPSDTYLRDLLGKQHVVALVALVDEDVIGGLVAYELDKLEQARREFYIYDLGVDERQRRRGIATALIAHLQEIASEQGAWVIFVQADYGDEPAIALYEKLGTREEVLHFDIPPSDRHRRSADT